jgi:hypothetical protein
VNTSAVNSQFYEFCFPTLDTLVQVEAADNAVVIRATRDTFSEERKARFIRELAAEGFISDDYRWSLPAASAEFRGVRWLVDFSWLKLHPMLIARTRRFMIRLLSGALLAWLMMIGLVFLCGPKCLATSPAAAVSAGVRPGGSVR